MDEMIENRDWISVKDKMPVRNAVVSILSKTLDARIAITIKSKVGRTASFAGLSEKTATQIRVRRGGLRPKIVAVAKNSRNLKTARTMKSPAFRPGDVDILSP